MVSIQEYFNTMLNHFHVKWINQSLNMDTILISLLSGVIVQIFFYLGIRQSLKLPHSQVTKMQVLIEMICELATKTVVANKPKNILFMKSVSLTLLTWITTMNLIDILPTSLALVFTRCKFSFHLVPTEDINLSAALGFSVCILHIFNSISEHGITHFITHFLKHPLGYVGMPVNIILNLTEIYAPPLSLTLRLFGNMFAGGLIFILISLAPIGIQSIVVPLWTIMHLPALFIQAFLFNEISMNFITRKESS